MHSDYTQRRRRSTRKGVGVSRCAGYIAVPPAAVCAAAGAPIVQQPVEPFIQAPPGQKVQAPLAETAALVAKLPRSTAASPTSQVSQSCHSRRRTEMGRQAAGRK